MTVLFKPKKAVGTVNAPPSKSVTHRLLICGAFTKKSVIKNIAFSEDITATVNCLKALGATVDINDSTVTIGGLNIKNIKEKSVLYCNESGSTLRFLIPIAFIANKEITFCGKERLFERPLNEYEELARQNNIYFNLNQKDTALTVKGNLSQTEFSLSANKSSQFISGMLFIMPFLNNFINENKNKNENEKNRKIFATLKLTKEITSFSYINLTLSALNTFGIKTEFSPHKKTITVLSSLYKSKKLTCEGDYSNAAFLEALNILGGKVNITGLNKNSLQGDKIYTEIFNKILKNSFEEIDLKDCPDLAPIAFTLAALKGSSVFVNTERLSLKESNRAYVMAEELKKFGADIKVLKNSVKVTKAQLKTPKEILYGHNDHRVVMSLSVLCTYLGGEIKGAEAINKSYPNFFKDLQHLNVDLEFKD